MNKVNTKVDMRLNVAVAGWISEDLKDALQRSVSPNYSNRHCAICGRTSTTPDLCGRCLLRCNAAARLGA